MIAVGEINPYAAEVFFFLPTLADPTVGKTGHVFVLGEVQYKFSGDVSWTDVPLDQIVEKGHGWYAIRLLVGQCAVANMVSYVANCADAQPDKGTETIDVLGGDIPQNGEGVLPFYLPNEADPIFGAPVTGYDFGAGPTTSLVQLLLPDGAFADANVSDIVERGNGLYWLVIGTTQTTKRGKAGIYADVPGAQIFSGHRTILGAGSISAATDEVSPTPIPTPIVFGDPEYVDHEAIAITRLLQQFKERLDA